MKTLEILSLIYILGIINITHSQDSIKGKCIYISEYSKVYDFHLIK